MFCSKCGFQLADKNVSCKKCCTNVDNSYYDVEFIKTGTNEMHVVNAVREVTGFRLEDAIRIVHNAPRMLKLQVPRLEAEAIASKMKAVGAEVMLRQSDSNRIKEHYAPAHQPTGASDWKADLKEFATDRGHYPNALDWGLFAVGLIFFIMGVPMLGTLKEEYGLWIINMTFWNSGGVLLIISPAIGLILMSFSAMLLHKYYAYMRKVATLDYDGITIVAPVMGVIQYKIRRKARPKYHLHAVYEGHHFFSPFLSRRERKLYANMTTVNILVSKEDFSVYRLLYKEGLQK